MSYCMQTEIAVKATCWEGMHLSGTTTATLTAAARSAPHTLGIVERTRALPCVLQHRSIYPKRLLPTLMLHPLLQPTRLLSDALPCPLLQAPAVTRVIHELVRKLAAHVPVARHVMASLHNPSVTMDEASEVLIQMWQVWLHGAGLRSRFWKVNSQ